MKLKDLFGSLFRAGRKKSDAASLSKGFMERCLDADPSDLRALVAREQQSLDAEVGDAVASIRFEMRRLAQRVADLPPKKAAKDIAKVREAQDALRRLMRRYAVSAKRNQELERELELWQQRSDEAGEMHADHPRIRTEIVRSELASRGVDAPARRLSPAAVDAVHQIDQVLGHRMGVRAEEAQDGTVEAQDGTKDEIDLAPHPDTAYLVQAIREATREAERWHGYHAEDPNAFSEAIDQVRHVRDLHAALKCIDRRSGVERDRVALAVRMRDE